MEKDRVRLRYQLMMEESVNSQLESEYADHKRRVHVEIVCGVCHGYQVEINRGERFQAMISLELEKINE